jgi:uncharacterized protein (TIGR02284 family)
MAADKTAGTLNRLIAVCRDGEEFYGYAAQKVSRPQLQELLRETAGLHREIADALRPHVSGAGASPAEGGTLAGKTRQMVSSLKATFANDTEQTLASALESTEEAAVDAFEKALEEPIADQARGLVAHQLEQLRSMRDRVRQLRHGMATAS